MKPKEPSHEATQVWIAMNQMTRHAQSRINAALRKQGLPSLTWYDVLWSVERQGGAVRPFEVERDVIFEQSNISYLTKKLCAEGLLEARDCAEDGRGKVLHITGKGRALRKRMWGVYGPMLAEVLRPFADMGEGEAFVRAARAALADNGEA